MKQDMRDAFFEELVECALRDERIVFLTADHGAFALKRFEQLLPRRYLNIGIAEQNMIGIAAGLASAGKIVFAYGISPFVSLRVMEHLTIDVAANDLAVNVVSVGAGFTYSTDGPTHQGLQDMAAVLTVPNLFVCNSSDPFDTKEFVRKSIERKKPHYIRIEKEQVEVIEASFYGEGYSKVIDRGPKLVIVTTGILAHKLNRILKSFDEDKIPEISLVNITQVKPFTEQLLGEMKVWEKILIIEEGYKTGFTAQLNLAISENSEGARVKSITPEEKYWFEGNNREGMYEIAGLSDQALESAIIAWSTGKFK